VVVMIEVKNLEFSIHKKQILQQIEFKIPKNSFTVIMGANGAGKSTLLQLLAGSLLPTAGIIFMDGVDMQTMNARQLAQKRAVLSQQYYLPFALTVREVVMMGRYPFFNNHPKPIDEDIVDKAMQLMDVQDLGNTIYQHLSGGEAQKVQMCRVLAQILDADEQNEKYLLLDEPVSQLDIKYQYQLMQIAKQLTRQSVTVIAILHDINLALPFADTLHFIKDGCLFTSLYPPFQISDSLTKAVFGIGSMPLPIPNTGYPFIYFQP
jgi:iron complex transport system ATP-binding protein